MGSWAIVLLSAAGVVALAIVGVLVWRRSPSAAQKVCGNCQRVMMPDWARCMFCGWTPASRLEFMTGPLAGQVLELTAEVTTMGSVAGNTIVLSDPAVSRKHIGIRRSEAGYELADLGSTNGVYVNGHRLPKKLLVSGDIMRVGNTEMVFRQG